MKSALEKNKEYSQKYIQKTKNVEIPVLLRNILEEKGIDKIVDLGCGDGGLIRKLISKFPEKKIYGVDISKRRIQNLKKDFPRRNFFCKDVCKSGLKEKFFDLIISTQVIEHLDNDKLLVKEIDKIAKKGSKIYVTSVIKKSFAIYKYRNKGKFVLDPTHEKEYKNSKEFLHLFRRFKLLWLKIYPVKRVLFGFKIKIPRYYIIEGVWEK